MSHIRTAEVATPIAGGSDILKINDGSDCYLLNDSIPERKRKAYFNHPRVSDLGIFCWILGYFKAISSDPDSDFS